MINFNGRLQSSEDTFLSYFNRGFQSGDVLFEQIRLIDGKIVFWEEHYFRLMASMRILRMDIPMNFTMEYLQQEILTTISSNSSSENNAIVTLCVFRQTNDNTKHSNQVSYLIEVNALSHSFYIINEETHEVELFKDYALGKDMLSNLNTNNKLVDVIAEVFARENGYDDCLLLNESKEVVRFVHGTLFLVNGTVIKTPALSNGSKNTVIRSKLIDIISALDDYNLEESSVSPFELQKADEMFILSIEKGIQPVTKYRKKKYKTEVAKDLLGKLNANVRLASLK